MNKNQGLMERSGGVWELCGATNELKEFDVPPVDKPGADRQLLLCTNCLEQIEHPDDLNPEHWRCLNDSMWSSVPAVQVMAWRILNHLRPEGWPQDLLDIMYLDEETLNWAQAVGLKTDNEPSIKHIDSNGKVIETGDTVVLIKDLNVKGAGFTAKRGTAVRNISLVHDNPNQIEGRVNGQHIVILTQFVKKSN